MTEPVLRSRIIPKWQLALGLALVFVLITSLLTYGLAAAGFPSPESLSVLFVIPVLLIAMLHGLWASLVTALLSVLAYDIVLLAPLWHQIGLFKAEHITKLAVLAVVAFVTSALAAQNRRMLAMQQEKLREAEREQLLSALLSSVSHDFKTPLVTIIGALSSFKSASIIRQEPNYGEVIQGALAEAHKLNRFISNLMEISRLESNIETIHKEPVLLRDLLASALKSLHMMIHKQRFSLDIPPDFPLLHVNPVLMELVFLNLLDNAIKYGPKEGEVKVIGCLKDDSAIIDIDDDGEGIPPHEREAIFVKFYRASKGDSKVAGTGLGLYICAAIIKAHGGIIEAIDPHDGKGACVRIILPKEALIPIALMDEMQEEEEIQS